MSDEVSHESLIAALPDHVLALLHERARDALAGAETWQEHHPERRPEIQTLRLVFEAGRHFAEERAT